MTKKVLVLDAHPVDDTLNRHLALGYADAAKEAGHDVRLIKLSDMEFDPDFGQTHYSQTKPLEEDLEQFMLSIEWCDHFVMTVPMWWGGFPAKTKALFDRALMAGRAFDTRNRNFLGLPAPMLTGKSGRVLVTSDTPKVFQTLVYGNAFQNQIRKQILSFVGIKPAKFTWFAAAGKPKTGAVANWLNQTQKLGRAAA